MQKQLHKKATLLASQNIAHAYYIKHNINDSMLQFSFNKQNDIKQNDAYECVAV